MCGLNTASMACLVVFAFASQVVVTAGDDSVGTSAQEITVRSAAKTYRESLVRGDVDALSAIWTEDGVFVDATGKSFKAQELIQQQFGDGATAGSAADLDCASTIRFVTSDVAIEEGTFQSVLPAADVGADGGFTAIWVKQDQTWRLARLQDWTSAGSAGNNPLDELAWMIGDWLGKGDGFTVKCSVVWGHNKKFIIRRFRVDRAGSDSLNGTQRIGWDPSESRIRSWVFDSGGGIVEGRWKREGDAWIVKTSGVLSDGSKSSAINFWLPESHDRCVLKTSHVKVGEVDLGDSIVEFTRSQIGDSSSPNN